ncbi:MAG: hypothetical protein P8Y17_00635 [Patescibacteria group bacterium]
MKDEPVVLLMILVGLFFSAWMLFEIWGQSGPTTMRMLAVIILLAGAVLVLFGVARVYDSRRNFHDH